MRIGIIGAGIAGLSAAHFLLAKGYRELCVIDLCDRVGGKCHTIQYKGKSYEMGAIMGLPSHGRIHKLMKRFNIKPSGVALTRGHYKIDGKLATQLPAGHRAAFIEQLGRLPDILASYPWLEGVGYINCPKPLAEPFADWCKRHGIEVLGSIYEQCFTTFGFGDVRQVPAAYVLKVITYENLIGFLEISQIVTWAKGTGALMEKLADQVPELYLAQEALEIQPGSYNHSGELNEKSIQVRLTTGIQHFDRLIYTGDMTRLAEMMPLKEEIRSALAQTKQEAFHVYAFKLRGIPELCGYVPENLSPERRGHLTVWYHRWPMDLSHEMVTVYAYDPQDKTEAERVALIVEDLTGLGCTDIQLHHSKGWQHFPHFETEVIQSGAYDLIEAIQGSGGVYFASELLSGPNMENCAAYSEQLVNQYF